MKCRNPLRSMEQYFYFNDIENPLSIDSRFHRIGGLASLPSEAQQQQMATADHSGMKGGQAHSP